MDELHHECGVVAIYHLYSASPSKLAPLAGADQVSRLMPRMLLDLQNRGQLAAGFTTYNPRREQIIDTFKQVGPVIEAFRLNHKAKYDSIMKEYAGRAAIGHVRYATCGSEDRSYAQPFERHHGCKWKWFSFAFNGQLANFTDLRAELLELAVQDVGGFVEQITARRGRHRRPGWERRRGCCCGIRHFLRRAL